MIKRIFYFTIVAVIIYFISYYSNVYVLNSNGIDTSFSLHSVYIFHLIGAVLVYAIIEFVTDILPTQAGYVYLASICLKIGVFVLIFKASIFDNNSLTKPERFSLIIPLFLFLSIEAAGVSKLLNNK